MISRPARAIHIFKKTKIKNLLIPVFFGNFIQTGKHNWQNFINILFNQTKNIFIIPEVQCSFCNLQKIMRNIKIHSGKGWNKSECHPGRKLIPENENWRHTWISA